MRCIVCDSYGTGQMSQVFYAGTQAYLNGLSPPLKTRRSNGVKKIEVSSAFTSFLRNVYYVFFIVHLYA
jgi:hypothetical protein